MKVPEYRRKDVGDFSEFQEFFNAIAAEMGASAPEVESLFEADNQQLERITSLAQRKITFDDNHNSDAVTLGMGQDAVVRFTPQIKGQPTEVLCVKVTGHFSPYSIAWRLTGKAQQVEATIHWVSAPSDPVDVTWRVWGE